MVFELILLSREICRTALTFLYAFQVSMEAADKHSDIVSEQAQLDKLERLEREYLRLTHTQNNAEVHTKTRWIEELLSK